MNRLRLSITAIIAILIIILTGCAANTNTDDEDGGVVHHSEATGPKEINSSSIKYFRCEFSTLTVMEEDSPIAGSKYFMEAIADGDRVTLRFVSGVPSEEQESLSVAGVSFMDSLQDIVSRYDFAQHNGYYHHVSGLPDNFGLELDIHYESGEGISASDNQDLFLPFAPLEELEALFREFCPTADSN